ncbi:DivIVA domain-containing protein [Litoribacter ruber]|uniref:DivIVA domain-containing protein n=1 Tax=Litoribacter ruber TaxID=702568 RepID=UPI001BDAF4B0|nr:DivIVA domain-containing protein [Litoribacter ruber]MBT0811261.1 DivIVA domain-containing protein [Litoribacter ruber]
MKITPLEIRQKTFERHFRGYDKEEVGAFLNSLSQEWERLMDEKKDLQVKLDQAEKQSNKLREVESSLFRTLKTAEDTGANIIEQAKTTADQIVGDAQIDADVLRNDAKQKSQNMLEAAEQKAREIMENLKTDIQTLVDNYEHLLEQRKRVLKNLQQIATHTIDTMEDAEKTFEQADITVHTDLIEQLSQEGSFESFVGQVPAKMEEIQEEVEQEEVQPEAEEEIKAQVEEAKAEPEEPKRIEEEIVEPEAKEEEKEEEPRREDQPSPTVQNEKKQTSGSFFDQFD